MIEGVLPSAAVWFETRGDPPEAVLVPAEAALITRAGDKRRREFTTGRYCAHRALARLGIPAGAILAGSAGEPRWPDGVVGSITHCAGYRAAAVAWATDLPALGIDAEPHEPLPAGVLDAVALPPERDQLRALAATRPATCWDRVLFCAKEAVYKAWYPHARRMLGFEDASITVATDGTLQARLLVPGPIVRGHRHQVLSGRWRVDGGLVLTAITHLDGADRAR